MNYQQLRKMVRNEFEVEIEKSDGYFYLREIDGTDSKHLDGLRSTSIYVCRACDMSADLWRHEVREILEDAWEYWYWNADFEETAYCDVCQKTVEHDQLVCPFCGTDVEPRKLI